MKPIKPFCLFLAFMLLAVGCRKKPRATKTRKELTETKILLQAARVGDFERIQSLILKGTDVNAGGSWDWTPLHGVAEEGHRELAELLIAKGANVNARDGRGRTPLWYAKDQGYTEIVELLRKHGAKE